MSYLETIRKVKKELAGHGAAPVAGKAPEPGDGFPGLSAQDIIDIDNGNIIALLIDSLMVGGPLWFAFDDAWKPDPDDTTPVFYASELPHLRKMTPEELRRRYADKKALGGGWIRYRSDNDAPACESCGAEMTRTNDIYRRAWWVCWECAKSI